MNRPEYVACVRKGGAAPAQMSWCGRIVEDEWVFTGVDHAIENVLAGGRILVCKECAKTISATLRVIQGE